MKLLSRPEYDRSILLRDGGWLSARHLFEYRDLAVSIDKLHGNAEVQQTRERFTRQWPRNHIASNYNEAHFSLTNLLKYNLQRRKIAVNIVDCCDPHDRLS
jgi:hypothetical protein